MQKKINIWIWWVLGLVILLSGISLFSLSVGAAKIPLNKIIPILIEDKTNVEASILLNIRLPRIILGLAVGGALSLAGVILQGMFRNPLVEPYTLGISGGAAIGVCLGIFFKLSHMSVFALPISGFLGAILIVLIMYSLSLKKGILKIHGFLLTGVMISFISTSIVMLFMAVSNTGSLQKIVYWIMGSLQEPHWLLIIITLCVSLGSLFISYFFCHDLNALRLGEEEATHLGIKVERTKKVLFVLTSLLTGWSVSITGMIGFVGLVVPHFLRIFIGRDYRILLVSVFLGGGIFLVFCDTIARTIIAPIELPVGVITGIIGGSLFIYALTKNN